MISAALSLAARPPLRETYAAIVIKKRPPRIYVYVYKSVLFFLGAVE
jgi:hypothetical protein